MACVPVKQHVQAFTLCLQKSSGQDSLAWKMLCALTSSSLATLGLLDPSLVPHSPWEVSWAPSFYWLPHVCPQTQSEALSIPEALRIKSKPFTQLSRPSITWLLSSLQLRPWEAYRKLMLGSSCCCAFVPAMPPACMPAHPVPPLTGDANSDLTSSEQILVPSTYDPAITA